MAQLKDSIITGDLRVTGTIYGNTSLNNLMDADDLKAIEELSGTSGWLKKTAENTWALGTLAASDIPNIGAGKITSGTLPVGRGGTGATTFTSGALLIGNGTNAVSTRTIKNMTASGNLGWTAAGTDIYIPTVNTLAYWNGRYNDSNSNLAYCNKGAFGNAVTYGVDDATANGALSTGTGLTTERSVYYGLVTVNNASQTRATGIYAPTSAGTEGYILKSSGGTSAPVWLQTLPIANGGTGATTAAAALTNLGAATSDHTHTTTIATSTGTNQLTLAFGTKYAITAGGTSYIFTTPADPNTDTAVLQTQTNSNHWRKVLVGYQYNENPNVAVTSQTNQAYVSPKLEFKSQSGTLKATEYSVDGNATLQYNSTTESLDFVF